MTPTPPLSAAARSDLAKIFGVSDATVDNWKTQHPDFLGSLKAGKEAADARVERALYQRATGYSYDAVKIFCSKDGKITKVPYRVHVPPDVTAQIFWLKNRDPAHWRDAWQLEHTLGKYLISDKPMTEEAWAKERANIHGPRRRADALVQRLASRPQLPWPPYVVQRLASRPQLPRPPYGWVPYGRRTAGGRPPFGTGVPGSWAWLFRGAARRRDAERNAGR